MRTEVAWTADFANLGYLAPLDGTPALDKTDDYLPQAVGSTEFKGKTYAAPQVIDTLGLFYNKKLLKDSRRRGPQDLRRTGHRRQEDQGQDRRHRPLSAR